jgi:hypothetical protein
MSWLAIAWSESAPVGDVYERAIITLMAHRANADGTGAFPSTPTLAKYAMCDERSIRRRLEVLRDRGLIAYGDQDLALKIPARYRPKVYDLLIPFTWYSAAQLVDVNRERGNQGLPPLSEAERPPIPEVSRARKSRRDAGISRSCVRQTAGV